MKDHRFATLDAMRGIAALAVLTGHLETAFGQAPFQHYSLAVDFFFVLSGFVLTHAYANKLKDGMKRLAFMRVRLIRIYPLYILGTILFAAYTGARVILLHDVPLSVTNYAIMLISAALFLPTPVVPSQHSALYPLNPPAWSLLFELIANAAWAFLAPRLTLRMLAALIVTGFVGQSALALHFDSFSMGWERETLLGGLARVTFSFFSGMLVYRLWCKRPLKWAVPILAMAVTLSIILALPVEKELRIYYELGATLLFPFLVYAGASSTPRAGLRYLCLEMGAMSYALYATHAPIIMIADSICVRVLGAPLEAFAPWGGIFMCVVVVLLAAIFNRVYDGPARKTLKRYFTRAS